ncbi:hypothetical protein V5O48_013658, partial [Marasmius crinis-equi]
YFIITQPSKDSHWQNGVANPLTWTKGVLDGINAFDLEFARLNKDGLMLVAQNVPTSPESLNIRLEDVPPGDDYFVLFMNSTHGTVFATSDRFSILSSASNGVSRGDSSVPTVTVAGPPSPTQGWMVTFPVLVGTANSARGLEFGFFGGLGKEMRPWALLMTVLGCVLGVVVIV